MQRQPKPVDRKVIPRWRRLDQTSSPELASAKGTFEHSCLAEAEFLKAEAAWDAEKNLKTAMEVVAGGAVWMGRPSVAEAGKFLRESKDAHPRVHELSQRIMLRANGKSDLNLKERQIDLFDTREVTADHRLEIAKTRTRLRTFPGNPIAHVDLARAYVSEGHTYKAQFHFDIALSLAPQNRFVVRSASRFYVHIGDFERALDVFNGCSFGDPWIDAARVAIADQIGGMKKVQIKQIRRSLDADLSPEQLTELNASLATLELGSGSTRRAKRLFQASASGANDNTVAQIRWADEQLSIEFDPTLLSVERSYEARAVDAEIKEDWENVVNECRSWLIDEPFSLRPVFMAGFVASEFLGKFDAALEFARAGLHFRRNDAGLLNNAAYALAALGKFKDADDELARAKIYVPGSRSLHVVTATAGFIEFRRRNFALGRELYHQAFDGARKLKDEKLQQQVWLHWMREEVDAGFTPPKETTDQISSRFNDKRTDKRVRQLFDHMLKPSLVAQKGEQPLTGEMRVLTELDKLEEAN